MKYEIVYALKTNNKKMNEWRFGVEEQKKLFNNSKQYIEINVVKLCPL